MYNSSRAKAITIRNWESVPIVDDLVIARATSTTGPSLLSPRRNPVSRMGSGGPGRLLPLDICEGSPCFASKGLLKAREQGLI